MPALPGNEDVRSINCVVGETDDGRLNDIRARTITRDDVFAAIRSAHGGAVEEGSVGAGTGTIAFDFKGGIGTSSRRLPEKLGGYTVGRLCSRTSAASSRSPGTGREGARPLLPEAGARLDHDRHRHRRACRRAQSEADGRARDDGPGAHGCRRHERERRLRDRVQHRAQRDAARSQRLDVAAIPGDDRGNRGGHLQLAVHGDAGWIGRSAADRQDVGSPKD